MRIVFSIAFACVLFSGIPAGAQQTPTTPFQQAMALPWKRAPEAGRIGQYATINLIGDIGFLEPDAASRFMVLNDNLPTTNQYVLAPKSLQWFAVFSFDPAGYVRDDEKIDSNQLLDHLKANNVRTNDERQRQGFTPLVLESWSVPPHYDVETKRLEWGTLLRTPSGETVVNYTTRILGRSGVIRGLLVSEPATLEADVRAFKQALRGLQYVSGETYAEFKPGDKLAQYGLTALVAGGAAAAAVSSGAGKAMSKFLGLGFIALGAGAIAWWRRLAGQKKVG
jgi:uncharacterized membrane-anchored protein